jgi:NADPH:quinone reductase
MRAAYYDTVGPAQDVLQMGELPTPLPGPGEVRIALSWSGVNPSDVKSRAGLRNRVLAFPRVIPHSDGMGRIDAVGDGVDPRRLGQRVWTWNAAWGRPFGTAAEFVCLPQSQAVPLPDNVPDEVGACLGIPALTALHAVLMGAGVAGKTVLVAGGAGAVGHYAVQLAGRLGAACVITTVSNEAKAARARAAGADAVINYRTEPVAERVADLTQGRGIDRVIEVDLATNGLLDLQILKTGGECIAYGSRTAPLDLPFPTLLAKNLSLHFFMVYHLPEGDRARALATLDRLLRLDALNHHIGDRLGLDQIITAHERLEQGQVDGQMVLRIDHHASTAHPEFEPSDPAPGGSAPSASRSPTG